MRNKTIEQDLEWLCKHQEITQEYRGKYVAIIDEKVAAFGESLQFDAGRYLGFRLKPNELVYSMGGIGGNIGYVIRNAEIILARRHSEIRVAWTLSAKTTYIFGQL